MKLNVAESVKTFNIYLHAQFYYCCDHHWNAFFASLWTEIWHSGEENVSKFQCSDVSIPAHHIASQQGIIIYTTIWLQCCGAPSRSFLEGECPISTCWELTAASYPGDYLCHRELPCPKLHSWGSVMTGCYGGTKPIPLPQFGRTWMTISTLEPPLGSAETSLLTVLEVSFSVFSILPPWPLNQWISQNLPLLLATPYYLRISSQGT